MLPLGPTGYADSPYQCFSAFAGNPNLISLERLVDDGLLKAGELPRENWPKNDVDYDRVRPLKYDATATAFTPTMAQPTGQGRRLDFGVLETRRLTEARSARCRVSRCLDGRR
jgi:4-alpha-glucanotransferase